MNRALISNGKSIIQIATTIIAGLAIWVFSPLKFQAGMGVLLAILLLLRCVWCISLLVPAFNLCYETKIFENVLIYNEG